MLVESFSIIELELDFAEEGMGFISNEELAQKLNQITIEIDKLLKMLPKEAKMVINADLEKVSIRFNA